MPRDLDDGPRSPAVGGGRSPANLDPLQAVLGAAESALGVYYRWGGNSLLNGVDCSGLVQQAFRAAGIELPRVSRDQAKAGQAVTMADAQPGDLLWFDNSGRNDGADHIAIYVGNGQMIEAPSQGKQVRVVPVRQPTGVTRVLGAVQPKAGTPAPLLGRNTDRSYTTAAVSQAPAPAPTETVTGPAQLGGGLGDDLPPNGSDQQIEAYIREHYADVAPFLANAEIRTLAFSAAREDWSTSELLHQFRQTEYFRTHGAASRAFDALIAEDGVEAGRAVDEAKNTLGDIFAQQGIRFDDDKLGQVAKQAIRNGWVNLQGGVADAAQLQNFVAFTLGKGPQNLDGGRLPEGEASFNADQLAALAKQYGVPLSRPTVEDWALRMINGQASEESFKSFLVNRAKENWRNDPDIIRHLDEGGTTASFFDSHRETIAKILEVDPAQIDLFDNPQWQQVTQHFDGEKRRAMTLGEVADLARKDARYGKTRGANEQAAEFERVLLQTFGRIAA